ncbi:unnamed protein product [Haemonchus placei]|uniref:Peptidase A1 domain-containing protein n=1 Tax=Haemonchus placei TaxID=6290 RepID=A0A0N4VX77_HAEPC|nr:unnamed protein product [Haemonchus placei]
MGTSDSRKTVANCPVYSRETTLTTGPQQAIVDTGSSLITAPMSVVQQMNQTCTLGFLGLDLPPPIGMSLMIKYYAMFE